MSYCRVEVLQMGGLLNRSVSGRVEVFPRNCVMNYAKALKSH